jgi:hypothetical protein
MSSVRKLFNMDKHSGQEAGRSRPVFPIPGTFRDLRSVIALAVRTEERRRLLS